jgi:AraC-like DNA-binding protein
VHDILGRRDEDISPEYLVEKYRGDDEAVLAGSRLDGLVELAHSPQGGFDWFITTKYPVRGRAGQIVGVAGITRQLMPFERAEVERFSGLGPAIELIARDFGSRLKIADLAGSVSMSTSQFTRVFRQRFGVSPHRYLQQVRTNAACDLLSTTDEPIAIVAQRTGFYDQSHLTNHFVRERGLTPRAYRERFTRPGR